MSKKRVSKYLKTSVQRKVGEIFTTDRLRKNLFNFYAKINWQLKRYQIDYQDVAIWADLTLRSDPYVMSRVSGLGLKSLDHKLVHLTVKDPMHPSKSIKNPYLVKFNSTLRAEALAHEAMEEFWQENQAIVPKELMIKLAMRILTDDSKEYLVRLSEADKLAWKKKMIKALDSGIIHTKDPNQPVRHIYKTVTKDFPNYQGNDDLIVDMDKYKMDCRLAKRLVGLSQNPPEKLNMRMFNQALQSSPVKLSSDQQKAIKVCLTYSPALLLGYAGTGKTTCLKVLTRYLDLMHKNYQLCSLSGRATDNIRTVTGAPAKTIDSLVCRPGLYDDDYLIIDEISMVGEDKLEQLLSHFSISNLHLIMLGDGAQLPAIQTVGTLTGLIMPGVYRENYMRLFRNDNGLFGPQRLTEVFRQNQSQLLNLVTNVRDHRLPDQLTKTNDSSVKVVESQLDTMSDTVKIATAMWKKYPNDSNIIVTANRNVVNALNNKLQQNLHQKGVKALSKYYQAQKYAVGDQVMVTKNCSMATDDNGNVCPVANGEIGRVVAVVDDKHSKYNLGYVKVKLQVEGLSRVAWFVLNSGTFTKLYGNNHTMVRNQTFADVQDNLSLGYAVTVHKAQGSTINNVIYYITNTSREQPLQKRQDLYTALTRASDRCILISSRPNNRDFVTMKQSLEKYLHSDAYKDASSFLPAAIAMEQKKIKNKAAVTV